MLCYVDDRQPGISRKRLKHGWAYYGPDGKRITDREEIGRLNRIALPPAYGNAWFCPDANGHIQATGVDARGRKQYRYHAEFRSGQEAEKYGRCADFGRTLPRIRARVAEDLSGRALGRDTVVAAVVRLLDLGHVRIGNEGYARRNRSFGATTLRGRHASVRGGKLRLVYRGKSGKLQRLTIEDKRLCRLVRRCQDLPGQHLFQYLDAEGGAHPVTSSDVNAYLRAASGSDFTAKHFRTWGASVLAYAALAGARGGDLPLGTMLALVSQALGNTPAISRKSYVHPALIERCGRRGGAGELLPPLTLPRATRYLSPAERGLLAFLDGLAKDGETMPKAA